MRPELAQKKLSPFAALTCEIGRFWPSFGACILPSLNFDFLRPARFSAVYFPAWFVTGEVEARVTYKGLQLKESAWFDNTYIPGSHVDVLSAAPLGSSFLMEKETVPFTPSLLHQHGEDVHCIPFSTSPFSILDVAASHPRSITINKDLSIDPSSVKPNLVSAYPVLLPLYLAQYEIQGGKDGINKMFTFIMKAHGDPELSFIMSENLSKIDIRNRESVKVFDDFCAGHNSSGEVYSFLPPHPQVSISFISLPHRKVITNNMNEWLEGLLSSSRNIEILAESSLDVIEKGDEDLRMREMTSEEGASLRKYTNFTERIMIFKRALNALMLLDRSDQEELSLPFDPSISGPHRKRIEERIKSLEAERAQNVPKWWLEWLALNRPESENA